MYFQLNPKFFHNLFSIQILRNPERYQVLVGTNDLQNGGKRYNVRQFITHEHYNNPKFAYDVGVIRVDGPIEFNQKVQPIKYSNRYVGGGITLQVTGWGRLNVRLNFCDQKVNICNSKILLLP